MAEVTGGLKDLKASLAVGGETNPPNPPACKLHMQAARGCSPGLLIDGVP